MDRHSSLGRGLRGWLWLVLLVVLAESGCGAKRGDVSGTVTYQGKPLPLGTVTFMDAKNESLGSSPITQGKYAIAKVPVGLVKVIVSTPPPLTGKDPPHPLFKAKPRAESPKKAKRGERLTPDPGSVISIPDKYRSPDQSDLTYTVTPGENTFEIELK
jgi:hypothetical protein